MDFVETRVFTRQITKLLSDDEYRLLQQSLIVKPDAGAVIRRGGGLRKLRWRTSGRGKRGGIRVIYYWYVDEYQLFMLLAYDKNEKDDLSANELKVLRRIVKETLA